MRARIVILMLLGLLPAVARATVPEQTALVTYTGDGHTTGWAFSYAANSADDLKVILVDTTTTPYTATRLTLTTHYTVAAPNGRWPAASCTVTTLATYSSSYRLVITTDAVLSQGLVLESTWRPAAVERVLDKVFLALNELRRTDDRAPHNPDALGSGLVTELAGYGTAGYVYRTASGNFSLSAGSGGAEGAQPLSTTLTALSGLSPSADTFAYFTGETTMDLATLTPFARTILDDADAVTAQTTLGLGITLPISTGNGSSYAITYATELVTIGATENTATTATISIPAGATVFDVSAYVVQAPSGGPTQWNAYITAMSDDHDSLFDAVAVTLATTATAMVNTDGTFSGPFVPSRSGASTITVETTDASNVLTAVVGTSLQIRFVAIYSVTTAPDS